MLVVASSQRGLVSQGCEIHASQPRDAASIFVERYLETLGLTAWETSRVVGMMTPVANAVCLARPWMAYQGCEGRRWGLRKPVALHSGSMQVQAAWPCSGRSSNSAAMCFQLPMLPSLWTTYSMTDWKVYRGGKTTT